MSRMQKHRQRNQRRSNNQHDYQIFNKQQLQISPTPFSKPQNSQFLFSKNKENDMIDDIVQLTHTKQQKNYPQRKYLPWIFFVVLILMDCVFTCYQALIFTRTREVIEYLVMELSFAVVCISISIFLVRDFKRIMLMYFMLDSLMPITLCVIATYMFPYIVMNRFNRPQILEQIGFFICNISMVGNFRIIMVHMEWTKARVLVYKLSKLCWISFYLVFGAIYTISYSQGTDQSTDNKVRDLVILFVFSGFALELEIFNRISDFDGTSKFQTYYLIPIQEQNEELSGKSQKSYQIKARNKQDMNQDLYPKQNMPTIKNQKIQINESLRNTQVKKIQDNLPIQIEIQQSNRRPIKQSRNCSLKFTISKTFL